MITFRFDDVGSNVNKRDLYDMTWFLTTTFPNCKIIYAITIFSKTSSEGSPYPNPPFKNNPHHFFYDVDSMYITTHNGITNASHGLVHGDHSRLDHDAQEMSIVMSCKLLKTNIFVPPFNRWNSTTEDVCRNNGIKLIKLEQGWKSLEHNEFNEDHELWYFHPWRYSVSDFKKAINSKKLGLLQRNSS